MCAPVKKALRSFSAAHFCIVSYLIVTLYVLTWIKKIIIIIIIIIIAIYLR